MDVKRSVNRHIPWNSNLIREAYMSLTIWLNYSCWVICIIFSNNLHEEVIPEFWIVSRPLFIMIDEAKAFRGRLSRFFLKGTLQPPHLVVLWSNYPTYSQSNYVEVHFSYLASRLDSKCQHWLFFFLLKVYATHFIFSFDNVEVHSGLMRWT